MEAYNQIINRKLLVTMYIAQQISMGLRRFSLITDFSFRLTGGFFEILGQTINVASKQINESKSIS